MHTQRIWVSFAAHAQVQEKQWVLRSLTAISQIMLVKEGANGSVTVGENTWLTASQNRTFLDFPRTFNPIVRGSRASLRCRAGPALRGAQTKVLKAFCYAPYGAALLKFL